MKDTYLDSTPPPLVSAMETVPPATCIHLFEDEVERNPKAVALEHRGERLTYEELNRRANRLAHRLRAMGVGPEVLVGLCFQRTPERIISLLAVLKAGGAYVPLEPTYPPERLAFMLEDARPRVLLAEKNIANRLPGEIQFLCVDSPWESHAEDSDANPSIEARPENLAYVIYTSGSTGRPKGVLIEHGGLYNMIREQIRLFGVCPQSRVMQFASFSFDASVSEIFTALAAGATLCLPPEEILVPGPPFVEWLREQAISVATLPPSVLAVLPTTDLPALTTVVAAGEELRADVVARWAGRRFLNAYGPTEATVCTTIAECMPEGGRPSIGSPIAHVRVALLDSSLRPVPIGIPGELYIGGVGLARGYLNRPELSAERFIADPLTTTPGVRLYRSGDIGRQRPDGEIEFLGRTDEQIKVRGFRIEPGEIEVVLAAHPAVREVVVIAREDVSGDKELVAYLVAAAPAPGVEVLHQFLEARLPAYMVPSAFVFLDALPRTPSQKLDRHALHSLKKRPASTREPQPRLRPGEAPSGTRDGFVAPRNSVELQLVQIAEEVLHVHPIGIRDRLRDLNRDSFLAVRLAARISERLGQELPLAVLFREETIERLARVLQDRSSAWPSTLLGHATVSSRRRSPIVQMRPSGNKHPFFFVAPLEGIRPGNILVGFPELARDLARERPFYALQPRSVLEYASRYFGDYRPDDSDLEKVLGRIDGRVMVDAAASCVSAIRQVQQEGPYLLGGFCNGSVLAFEIAQQLHQQRHAVSLLALVDFVAPIPDNRLEQEVQREENLADIAWFVGRDLAGATGRPLDIDALATVFQQLTPGERWLHAARELKSIGAIRQDTQPDEIRRLFLIKSADTRIRAQAMMRYTPGLYPGQITVLHVPGLQNPTNDPSFGWNKLSAQPVQVKVISGDHGTLFLEPHLEVLVSTLSRCITEADREEPGRRSAVVARSKAKAREPR